MLATLVPPPRDGIELMYQTRASVIRETPEMAAELNGRSIVLFDER